MQLFCNKF